MIKRALAAVAAILGLCISILAQGGATSIQPVNFALSQATSRDMVEGRTAPLQRMGSFRALNDLWYGAGPLTLLDGRLFSFPGTFGWLEATPMDFLPDFAGEALPRVKPGMKVAPDSSDPAVDLLHRFDYVGGEVGLFYGRSTGKFSREVEQGYIRSDIVDGNTQISVGAFYEHSSGRVPRIIGH
jgi:hypothetical protein